MVLLRLLHNPFAAIISPKPLLLSPVLDTSTGARRQTAIYEHAKFPMQNSPELCIPCESNPSWEKITSAWKQRKRTCLKLQTAAQKLFLVLKGTVVPIPRISICIIPSNSLEWNPQHTLFTWRSLPCLASTFALSCHVFLFLVNQFPF